jgi:uncharacterized protein YbgA (DUF1722 family)
MDQLWMFLALIGVIGVGLIKLVFTLKEVSNKTSFLLDYRHKFISMANSFLESGHKKTLDYDLYTWLTLNVAKAQRMLGPFGVGGYISPFQMFKANNYEYLGNTLPKFRESYLPHSDITNVDDILMRTIGFYQEVESNLKRELINPFKWLRYGVVSIIGLPINILKWLNIIPLGWYYLITASRVFKTVSGLISLIGFASAVVGLITGWDQFVSILHSWKD